MLKIRGQFHCDTDSEETLDRSLKGMIIRDLQQSSAENSYDCIAWIFGYIENPMEMMAAKKWGERLFSQYTKERKKWRKSKFKECPASTAWRP